jgi:hypothetical protein
MNGGETISPSRDNDEPRFGHGGAGEKISGLSISVFRIVSSEGMESQGGGRMLARRWRCKRRAR